MVMQALDLAAHAGERLGTDVQAVSLVRRGRRGRGAPRVWEMMTENGFFWLVERAGTVEMFRAALTPGSRGAAACASPREAIRRFLDLHPD